MVLLGPATRLTHYISFNFRGNLCFSNSRFRETYVTKVPGRKVLSQNAEEKTKKGVLKNFAKFTGNHSVRVSFCQKSFLWKTFLRKSFLKNTSGRPLLNIIFQIFIFRAYGKNMDHVMLKNIKSIGKLSGFFSNANGNTSYCSTADI